MAGCSSGSCVYMDLTACETSLTYFLLYCDKRVHRDGVWGNVLYGMRMVDGVCHFGTVTLA